MIRKTAFKLFIVLTIMALGYSSTKACTDVIIRAKDGSALSSRSMEFGAAMNSRLVIRPRGTMFHSPAPDGMTGKSWAGKYGFVYLDGLDIDCVVDGLNEAGLGFGALYLPDFAEYEKIDPISNEKALSNLQLGAWVLSQFSTIDEVESSLSEVNVWGEILALFDNGYVPLHYVVHDSFGQSIVLEWVGGKLNVYDNTIGVMTNSPPYDWHMTNLRNYISLSPNNANPVTVGGITYPANGQGSGLFGMPGDPTPPSRFVQTAIALTSCVPPLNSTDALIVGQKLLNRVDLPEGLARDPKTGDSDITQWAVFRSHNDKIYYYRTYNDMTLRAIDLKETDLNIGAPVRRMQIAAASPTVNFIDPNTIPLISK
jgi:choloylglycine hydrolase